MREKRNENLQDVATKNLGAREKAKAENQRLLQLVVNSPAKINIPNVKNSERKKLLTR